ncbi:MAG: hypothetical protein LBR65_00070 [Culturomica sp.]|nr:hypothetical protein [Culturomica sp.]
MKSIYGWGLLLLLATTACKDDPAEPVVPEPPVPPLPALAKPKNLSVAMEQAKMVVVMWEGDTTATSYQVQLADQLIELEGTSCGVQVTEQTPYTWMVRAIRRADTTDWVLGPGFTTPEYDDLREEWIGYWGVDTWDLKVEILSRIGTVNVPLDDFMAILPQDVVDTFLESASFKLSIPVEEAETDQEALLITFDLLEQFGLPAIASIHLEDEMFWLEQYMQDTLSYPGTPVALSEIPFLQSIPQLQNESFATMVIQKLQIVLTGLQLKAGPINEASDRMSFTGTLEGPILIETDQSMMNVTLGLANLKMRVTFTSDVERRPAP